MVCGGVLRGVTEREIRLRLKPEFDRLGIVIPVRQHTVLVHDPTKAP